MRTAYGALSGSYDTKSIDGSYADPYGTRKWALRIHSQKHDLASVLSFTVPFN